MNCKGKLGPKQSAFPTAKCTTIAGCDNASTISLETMWLGEVCMCILALVVGVEYLHRSLTGL